MMYLMDKKLFGSRLKKARKKKGVTQKELVEMTGFSTDSISRWENGVRTPSVEDLASLSSVLGVTFSYLAGESEDYSYHNEQNVSSPITNNGTIGIGNNGDVIGTPTTGADKPSEVEESLVILTARALDLLTRKQIQPLELETLTSMWRSGLLILERRKKEG